jgi:hypothetical protein
MKIEKPISTIRKAIKISAEQTAQEEFLKKPEKRHYEEAFSFYKYMKLFEPENYEKMIVIGAKGSELKDKMSPKLYKEFTNILEEVTSKNGIRIEKAINVLKDSGLLSSEQLKQETLELNKELIAMNYNDLINDPRLKSAFKGKEGFLKKVIDFTSNSMTYLIESNSKYPTLRIL